MTTLVLHLLCLDGLSKLHRVAGFALPDPWRRQHQHQQLNHDAVSCSSSPSRLYLTKRSFGSKTGNSSASKGFGAKSSSVPKKPSKKVLLKRMEKTYGGTSAQQIAQATQDRIETAMRQLPPHLQMATQLYQQLQKWDARLGTMTVLQQAQLPTQEMEGAQRARTELQRIYNEHNLGEVDVRNIFQQITWDASADAKAARSVTGNMPTEIAERVDRACDMIAQTVGESGRCLDVGCGFGVLVPSLTKTGRLEPSQIHGIDLSPEMIKNAQELNPGPTFEAMDFLQEYNSDESFEAVVFCSSLHDMPDMDATIRKAWSLVKPAGGRLFVLHAQGASHVVQQSRANPVLVPRELPTVDEYQALSLEGVHIVVEPAKTRDQDEREGYLAVLEKS